MQQTIIVERRTHIDSLIDHRHNARVDRVAIFGLRSALSWEKPLSTRTVGMNGKRVPVLG